LFPLDGNESPLSDFDFTPGAFDRTTEISSVRVKLADITTSHLVAVNF
jgi:hypothetical protein